MGRDGISVLSVPPTPPHSITTHVLRVPRPEAASSHQNGGGGRDRREEGKTQGLPVPPPCPDSLGSVLGPLEGRVASEADRSALSFLIAEGRGGTGSTLYPLLPLFRYQGPGSPVSYAPFQGSNSRKRRAQDLTSCLQNSRDPREGWPLTLGQLPVPHASPQKVSLSR